ncbi:MAG: PrgI family protein [Candidatus Colwellbacteria bacterium]|nr:PrgI family protein [Candidatus Colwellbacteria bacterium]
MQFQVPQFIETEDKIVGPLTLKQFLYLAAAGIIAFLLFFALQFWLWLIITSVLAIISSALALVKVNGRPMIVFVSSAFSYIWNPKLYTLQQTPAKYSETPKTLDSKGSVYTLGGLKSLLQALTTSKNAIPKREASITQSGIDKSQREIKERYEIIRRVTGAKEIARRVDYR